MDIIIKTTSSKSRKIGIVTNGLVHGFGQKFFQTLMLRKIGQKNVFTIF